VSDSSNGIVTANGARQPLTSVQAAQRRLERAQRDHADAERREELADRNVVRHGGPAFCSCALIARLIQAHEYTYMAALTVRKWEQRLACELIHEAAAAGRSL
jgi:hypothetical protein